MYHPFDQPICGSALPDKFTYPFCYEPHPLCKIAAKEVMRHLEQEKQWSEELSLGKMFGVLVVKTPSGDVGFLAAFSGNLAGKNYHPYFVPPVADLQNPEGFFKVGEREISKINLQIRQMETDREYLELIGELKDAKEEAKKAIKEARIALKAEKATRDLIRKETTDPDSIELLNRESAHQKGELKRLERDWGERISIWQAQLDGKENELNLKKAERRKKSAALQLRLFDEFQMLNAKGEVKDLGTLFETTSQKIPPAGAGECAAPKLLQFAFRTGLQPIAMAEFWWGASPKTEIRHHGNYYPACKGKCEPILKHMLKGLDVEPDPMKNHLVKNQLTEILYEDDWIAIYNKPEGILSVPGKLQTDSIQTRAKMMFPNATGPLVVHRLDMATSGVLLVAKSVENYKILQEQFRKRTVKKRYVALLEGLTEGDSGIIDLPICLNPLDRPRQEVNPERGKVAITHWKVVEKRGTRTVIEFYPITGRTHQLRVHAAHTLGLGCPIVGDELYGKKEDRLYLHAEYLEFTHPVSGERMCIEKKSDFL